MKTTSLYTVSDDFDQSAEVDTVYRLDSKMSLVDALKIYN